MAGDVEMMGEWPGFLKLDPVLARKQAAAAERLVAGDRQAVLYEPALHDR
jgi:hypothetical protein